MLATIFNNPKKLSKLSEILKDSNVESSQLNDYVISILHSSILEIMGCTARIVFSYNYDLFAINSMFYLKTKKKSTNGKI